MTDKRYILVTQMKSALKPAEHKGRLRSERRIKYWRAGMIAMFTFFALLIVLVCEVGALDFLVK